MVKRILLVEDDPDDLELTLLALRRLDISTVDVARDGVEALSLLFDHDNRELPALVLLDVKLPRMGGLQVLERIKQNPRSQKIPVVMFSSSSEECDIDASYRLGANSYIRKQVDFEAHAAAMRQVGNYWLCLNE